MKTSNVLASLFFGSFAVAAPLEKRYYKTKTEVVVVTEVVYTTVFEGEAPATVAATTSAIGVFAEQPASSSAKPTSSAAPRYTPTAVAKASSSAYTPPPASSTSVYTPPAPSSSSVYVAPAPVSSSVYVAPAPVSSSTPAKVSSAAPAQTSTASTGGGGGQSYKGDITMYDNTGAPGACGVDLTDDMEICAIAVGLWDDKGGSTYNVMTGAADNPYCGKTATITYGGVTATCVIQDMCPGCGGDDLDLSHAVWEKLTGTTVGSRYVASWSVDV